MHKPCWTRCHHPPEIRNAAQAAAWVDSRVRPKLRSLDRGSGALTTTLFKKTGIQGWRDYCLPAEVVGVVEQAAHSTDRMLTVDMRIERLAVGGGAVPLQGLHFVRVEMFHRVWKPLPRRPGAGQHLRIAGRLMWDGDGFLEIHPESSADVTPSP